MNFFLSYDQLGYFLTILFSLPAFWLKEAVVYEQPRVMYRYMALFQLHGSTTTGDDVVNIFYSTSSAVNDLFSEHLRTPIVKSAELDDNADGMVDRIEIGLTMPLSSSERITGFTSIIYHDVELKDKGRYRFDAVSYVSTSNPNPMGSLYVDGDITVRQTWPLDYKGGYHN